MQRPENAPGRPVVWRAMAAARMLITLVAIPAWTVPVAKAAELQSAKEAYQAGIREHIAGKREIAAENFAIAVRTFRELAERGDAEAQYWLANAYEDGQGVARDYAEAAKWYRKAADQGFSSAEVNLGALYYLGQGVPHDIAEALRW